MVLQAYTFPEEGYSKAWEDYVNDFGTPREVDREVAVYEGAIDTLDQKGLIDRNRVGIIGFSRTCLSVKYMLSHGASRFAAASVTDGLDGGYFQYISYPQAMQTMESLIGAPPFGSGLHSWLKRSPGFSIDSVQTPLRIVALNPGSLLGEWEWFSALKRLGKPVEMVATRDGTHELQRPWDRMVSQGGNVDWFDFWLSGREDPDPAKTEQYARWRQLRKLQEENEMKAKAAAVN
jgi:dipeptidyl aminopeptidase/acylaminoacyl peptidase